MKKAWLFLLLPALWLVSCDKNPPIDPPDEGDPFEMLVVNEGVWGGSSSSLSALGIDGTMASDLFQPANNRPLGDAAQSIAHIDGNYYVTVNASSKIEVINPQTFASVKTILLSSSGGLDLSPLFVVGIGNHQAIVSTHDALVRINTQTFTVMEEIPAASLGGWPDRMIVVGNKLFCGVWKPDLAWTGADTRVGLAVFDLNNIAAGQHRMVPGALIGDNDKTCKLILDKNGKLWTVAHDLGMSLTLNRINPTNETIETQVVVPFTAQGEASIGKVTSAPFYPRTDTDRTRSKIYITLNRLAAYSGGAGTEELAVYTLDVNQTAISAEPFCTMPDVAQMYGMGVSPDGQGVLICDCISWLGERGKLRYYGSWSTRPADLVGIFPVSVYFTEYNN